LTKEGKDDERSCGIIENSSQIKLRWDFFIILLAIFNGITIPVAIAFAPAWSFETWYTWTDAIFNLFYLIDIGVQFSTSYVSSDGFIQYNRCEIAKRYLAGGFLVDLLSSIPYSLIPGLKSFKVIAILKAIRVFRLGALIDRL
jgi:hypothetical protein